MDYKIDFSLATSEAVEDTLGKRLEEIRLSRNITQDDLARAAGVSRSTVKRLAQSGKGVSLDSFIRIIQALDLSGRLQALLPDPDDSPLLQLARHGKRRRRARRSAGGRSRPFDPHRWGEEQEAVREWDDQKWPWENQEDEKQGAKNKDTKKTR